MQCSWFPKIILVGQKRKVFQFVSVKGTISDCCLWIVFSRCEVEFYLAFLDAVFLGSSKYRNHCTLFVMQCFLKAFLISPSHTGFSDYFKDKGKRKVILKLLNFHRLVNTPHLNFGKTLGSWFYIMSRGHVFMCLCCLDIFFCFFFLLIFNNQSWTEPLLTLVKSLPDT